LTIPATRKKVDTRARKQCLDEVRNDYAKSDVAGRSKLLDEAQKRAGLTATI